MENTQSSLSGSTRQPPSLRARRERVFAGQLGRPAAQLLVDLFRLLRGALVDVERQLAVAHADADAVVRGQRAAEDRARQLVLDLPLDRSPQRTRPELRIEADFRQALDGVIAELDLDVLRAEAAVNERSPPSMKARRLLG